MNMMKKFISKLSKTEVVIYWYCTIVDFPKDIRQALLKKNGAAWIVLMANLVITTKVSGTEYETPAKILMLLLVFLV